MTPIEMFLLEEYLDDLHKGLQESFVNIDSEEKSHIKRDIGVCATKIANLRNVLYVRRQAIFKNTDCED